MSCEDSTSVEYRPIEGFPFYRVGDDGSVWSRWKKVHLGYEEGRRWKRLACPPNPQGYREVALCNGEIHETWKVHHLVLFAFRGPPASGQITRHLNGVSLDNRLENLVWGTHLENSDDARRHGTQNRGERCHRAKLTAEEVRAIRKMRSRGVSVERLCSIFNVSVSNVHMIVRRKAWKHVL